MFTPETFHDFKPRGDHSEEKNAGELIHIISQAKKEELDFNPNQFVYAESQGNYVVFHLIIDDKPREVMIRNSIKDIEQQLKVISFLCGYTALSLSICIKLHRRTGTPLGTV